MQRFIYADKVGAGPEHPNKRWGLFSDELTVDEAKRRYSLNAVHRQDWFGVIFLADDEIRPSAYLQVCPRANGVVLHKLNQFGSIETAYSWVAYYDPEVPASYEGNEQRIFLAGVTSYVYPDEERFFRMSASLGHVSISFRADGYAKKEQVRSNGVNQPSAVETSEFRDVDVSDNWFQIPEFGDWGAFFNPDPKS